MFYTFVMFNNLLQIQPFLKNLNNKHYRMKFTLEFKRNSSIVFLDMNIVKHKDSFATNLYKKPTFTGLGCRYDRAISVHKTGSITCLIDCAYKIYSTYEAFCSEMEYIRKYSFKKKYHAHVIENSMRQKLNQIFSPSATVSTVATQLFFS